MRYLYLFFILISCTGINKTYMCGDKACLDKKQFEEYFSQNLIVEIQTKEFKENSSVDLVKLNTNKSNNIKKNLLEDSRSEQNNQKEEKIRLKAERKRLKEERKIKKKYERDIIETKKEIAKLNKKFSKKTEKKIKNNLNKTKQSKKIIDVKKSQIIRKNLNNRDGYKSIKLEKNESICSQIKDCDIDKIADLLIKKGEKKSFPNITSK
jgi:hypothetical protein